MTRWSRRILSIGVALGVVGILLFVFLWPLPHSSSGRVNTADGPGDTSKVNLPSGEQITVVWSVVGGARVQFQVDYVGGVHGPQSCLEVGNGSTCSFITSFSGAYQVWALSADYNQKGPPFYNVTYSVSYYAPIL